MSTPSTPSPSGKDRPNWIERRLSRFMQQAPTVKNAALAIVAMTVFVVVGSGILMTVVDRDEYSNVWVGMWWALQTVTTVGYGDVTPTHVSGRLVGAVVMLQGIAFIAIVTAVITSTFVARAAREQDAAQAENELSDRELIEKRFDDLERKLDRLAATLPDSEA